MTAKGLKLRVSIEVTPEGSYASLMHASSMLPFDHTTQVSVLINDAKADVQSMIQSAVSLQPVAQAIHEIKEAAGEAKDTDTTGT